MNASVLMARITGLETNLRTLVLDTIAIWICLPILRSFQIAKVFSAANVVQFSVMNSAYLKKHLKNTCRSIMGLLK